MNAPKFEIARTQKDGKPAVELIVRNSRYDADFHALIESLGYEPTVDIANRRSIVCTTAEQIDAARDPLASYFDARGEWK